ncbi:MAG: heat-inducible transcriptional repressor HrcA [Candidatus Dormibacteraeota bacterium]|nr:heat-inducible transcriptional repressor HrcA [Candidatus Dormibacteraeota bacterium]
MSLRLGAGTNPMEPRKQEILKAVVDEFTVTAVPVGSAALVSRHSVRLSAATVRNELSELVELGYLVQPHTSAGRMPSDQGYRYFVDFLMSAPPPGPGVDAYIEGELRQVPADAQSLVERLATVIAAVTQSAAVVTAPHGSLARIKHLDLVALEPAEVLVVVVVEGNLIRQHVIRVSRPTDQAELSRLAAKINRDLLGRDRDEVRLRLGRAPGTLERELLERLGEILELFERGAGTMVVHDGVRNLLKQPEFADAARLQKVLEVLEETRHLAALLQELVGASDMQIVIGSENRQEQLRSCTVILTTYGPSQQVKGVLGVVGPTRMDYGATVGRLHAVARRASERMAEA